jgi:aryl-alcohol dehydrogenase-like predicted oxidoreductase
MNTKIARLGIGTAQFGMTYGVTNSVGAVPLSEAVHIIKYAQEHNAQMILDTAPIYGESERVLGQGLSACGRQEQFRIITKTVSDPDQISAGFSHSLCDLGKTSIHALLDHNASHLKSVHGPQVYKQMMDQKHAGRVKKIGATIYSIHEALSLLENYDLDVIQLPLSVFDQRALQGFFLKELHDKGIEIHARSVFLQGILLADVKTLPQFFQNFSSQLIRFEKFCHANQLTKLQACLDFVFSVKEVDCILVGVHSLANFQEILSSLDIQGSYDYTQCAQNDKQLIDPRLWPRKQ